MKKLINKTALVTGGNSGIGYAAAAKLVAEGAEVIITGRRAEAIETASAQIGATAFTADQSSIADIDRLVQKVKDDFGTLDILFINAGVTGTLDSIENATPENFDTVMGINFRGAFFTLSRLIPCLNDGASVIILSSMVSATYKANASIYQASKAALTSFAKTAAAELAGRKIRVNIISPGPHHTEIMKKAGLDETMLSTLKQHLVDTIPLRKMGDPEDVASLVVYLSEPHASFITGADIFVDGGLTL